MREQGQEELEGENEVLKEAREQATSLALQAGQEQKDCGLDIVPEDFAAGALKWGLMEVGLLLLRHSPSCCKLLRHPACMHRLTGKS